MDRERLKELREETAQYRAVADDRCMSTQYEDDLLALIDAALAEPDADVAEAIEDLESGIECADELTDEEYVESHLSPQGHALAITALRQYQKPSGETSDGYHTFNELYHHRAILFAALSKAYPDKAWKSRKHHDGTMFDDETFICGIKTPEGHYTYHYNTRYWPMFTGKILENAPEWDGHKPEDVDRLMSLQGYQKPTDKQIADDILRIEQHMKHHWAKEYPHAEHITASLGRAIQALRQMGSTEHSTRVTEPCEYPEDTYSQCEECGQAYLDNRGYDYCPNCGRPLKGR